MTNTAQTIDDLIFEPLHRNMNGGNEMQVCKTNYKGVDIIERTYIPWSVFKDPSYWYCVDLIFPMGTMECLSDVYYTDEGFGMPEVNTLEEAVAIIDKFRDKAVS